MEQKKTGFGVASLVTGILSLVLLLMPYFGLPLAIFAIVASSIQKKHYPSGLATAGLVLGIIGVILNAIFLIFAIIGLILLSSGL